MFFKADLLKASKRSCGICRIHLRKWTGTKRFYLLKKNNRVLKHMWMWAIVTKKRSCDWSADYHQCCYKLVITHFKTPAVVMRLLITSFTQTIKAIWNLKIIPVISILFRLDSDSDCTTMMHFLLHYNWSHFVAVCHVWCLRVDGDVDTTFFFFFF